MIPVVIYPRYSPFGSGAHVAETDDVMKLRDLAEADAKKRGDDSPVEARWTDESMNNPENQKLVKAGHPVLLLRTARHAYFAWNSYPTGWWVKS